MQYFGTRSALVAGVIALTIGIGAGAMFASQQAGAAFAQGSETEFVGVVEALPATGAVGTWRVSGRTVIVTEGTEIDREGQTLAPGLRVEVEGYTQPDGTIVAEQIEVREADDDGGPLANGDDDDGLAAPLAPGVPPVSRDDDDGGPGVGQGNDGGPTAPNATQAGKGDDD